MNAALPLACQSHVGAHTMYTTTCGLGLHTHICGTLTVCPDLRAHGQTCSVLLCAMLMVCFRQKCMTKWWSLLRSMLSIIAEYPDSHEHVGSHTCVHTPFGQLVILRTKRGLHGHHELWRVGVHVVDGPKS